MKSLHKMVNGVEVVLTPKEEAEVRRRWELNTIALESKKALNAERKAKKDGDKLVIEEVLDHMLRSYSERRREIFKEKLISKLFD